MTAKVRTCQRCGAPFVPLKSGAHPFDCSYECWEKSLIGPMDKTGLARIVAECVQALRRVTGARS